MPLKLKISKVAAGRPVLRLSDSPAKGRGRAARLRLAKENEVETRSSEAQMQVTLICYSLWAGFWFQFVIGVCYNLPSIHTLSGGNWYAPDLDFYLVTPESFPFSIVGNFLFYSVIGSALALFFAWIFTKGVSGKWRLRFVVVLFVTIIIGWSGAAFLAEEAAWNEGLKKRIAKARQDWRWAARESDWDGGGGWHEYHFQKAREKVERLEALAERNPYREN